MSRVMRTLCETETSICELLHVSRPVVCNRRLRAVKTLFALALIAVHHLILSLKGGSLVESCALWHLLFACRRWEIAASHPCHWIIIGHCNLPVILVVFSEKNSSKFVLTVTQTTDWTLLVRKGSTWRDGKCSSLWSGSYLMYGRLTFWLFYFA